MISTDPKEFETAAFHALLRTDFSSIAQVRSVWSDSPFVDDELNKAVRERILSSFASAPELQYHEPLNHPRNPLIAVYQGNAGAGKTQLLGQIREAVVAPRTQFLLVDMTGVNKFQPTVCLHMVQSLLEPAYGGETQLRRVLARIYQIAQSLDSEETALEALTSSVAADFDAAVDGVLSGLRTQLAGPPAVLAIDSRKQILRGLMMLSFLSDDRSESAYSWLQGAEIDRQDSERLRLPLRVEPLDIIRSLSWLMGFRGKTLLAFDQLDVMVTQFETAARGGETQIAAAAKAVVIEIAGGLAALCKAHLYRTQIVVTCLEQTWDVLKAQMLFSIMDTFWPKPAILAEISSKDIAKKIVELRLRQAYGDVKLPYPTYPFTDDFFEAGITPRTLLQRCSAHREECLRLGKVIEAGKRAGALHETVSPTPPSAELDEEFAQLRQKAAVDSMLRDADASEEELGQILENTCELLLLEVPPPRDIEPRISSERERSRRNRTALHSRLSLTFLKENDREEFFCFRAIQRVHATAFQSRLKAAITDSGLNLGLKFRRLVILRTQPLPTGAKSTELLGLLNSNGGRILSIETSELQALLALIAMKKKGNPKFEAWLRDRGPMRKLPFVQKAFQDYFALIQAPDAKASGSPPLIAPPTPSSTPPDDPGVTKARSSDWLRPPHQPEVSKQSPSPDTPESARGRSGSIIIGKSVGPLGQKIVDLPLQAFTRHVLIRAGSGGGKTVLLKRLVEAAAIDGVPSIVLDPGNDLVYLGDRWPAAPSGWLPDDAARAEAYFQRAQVVVWTPGRASGRPLAFSPLPVFSEVLDDPDELEAAVQMAAGSLYESTGASRGATAEKKIGLLTEAIRHFARQGGQTLASLVEFLRDLPVEAQFGIARAPQLARDMADTLQGSLLGSRTLLPDSGGCDPSQLLGMGEPKTRISVISLAGLSETNGERLIFVNQLAVALFTWIRQHPASEAGRVRGLLVVDEARDFIPSVRSTPCKDSLMRLAAQARKYGFGILLATQNPTDIDHKAAGQCATQFFGRAASPNVVGALREAIEERGGSASDLTQMEKGQFYFSAEHHKIPTKVQVPMCLSHHPDGKTLSEAEILFRANS